MPPILLHLATTPAPSGNIVATVWDMALKGGWMMIPLALCSLAAMTLVVERFIITRRNRIVPPTRLAELTAMREDPQRALTLCQTDKSPLCAVIAAAIHSAHLPRETQERHIAEAGEREVRTLRQRMRLLSSLPQAATMLGLLGTVIGMIRTFTVVAASGESLGKTERLAQGIYEAWTATAAGLLIAVPTLICFQLLMARIDSAAAALDNAAQAWLRPAPAQPAAPALTRTVASTPAPEEAPLAPAAA